MTQKTLSSTAWILIIVLAFIWGGSFLSVRVALDEIGPLTSVAHRTFWGMLVLWIYVAITRKPIPKQLKTWGIFFVMGVLNNVIPFGLMAWGQLYIESGLTAILNASTAVFGVLIPAMFLADERLTPRKAVGVTIGFLGVATAIGLGNLMRFNLQSLAQLAVIGGAVSYAFGGVWGRKTMGGFSPQIAATGMLTGSTLVTIPMAIYFEGPLDLALSAPTWAAIFYYAVIATALAYLLYYRVLMTAGASNVMLVTLLVAPVAIILGAIFRAEALGPNAYFGFALLAVGLVILDGRLLKKLGKQRTF